MPPDRIVNFSSPPSLRIYVSDADPNQISASSVEETWSLPIPAVKDFLEFLSQGSGPRWAVIDGCLPNSNIQSLKQLMGTLRLHQCEPILIVRSPRMLPSDDLFRNLSALFRAGLSCVHIELDASFFEAAGLEAVSRFYDVIAKESPKLSVCYQMTGNKNDRKYLHSLMDDPLFNQMSHRLDIEDYQSDGRLFSGNQTKPIATEFVVGHRGTVVAYCGNELLPGRCHLCQEGWQDVVNQWKVSIRERHVSV